MKAIEISEHAFDLRDYTSDAGVDREFLNSERARMRKQLDTTYYDRADLSWYADTDIGYFGFPYDSRLYDPMRGIYPVEELVDRLRDSYGAVDTLMIWSGYPRLGIDQRTQFDIFAALPGGLSELRKVSDRLHRKGVQVFLPYLPWNVGDESESYEEAGRFVGELGVDGLMLDTMGGAVKEFRNAVDRARPGVVLVPEHVPSTFESAALCTGSTLPHDRRLNNLPPTWWGAIWQNPEDVPLDVVTLRWLEPRFSLKGNLGHYPIHDYQCPYVASDFFHGIGHQVIENLFGRTVSFGPEAARILRRSVEIRHLYRTPFRDPNWEPYIPTLRPGLLCHEWHGEAVTLYTVFNATPAALSGDLFCISAPERAAVHDAWAGKPASAARVASEPGLVVRGTVNAQRCGCFVVTEGPTHVVLTSKDRTPDPAPPVGIEHRFLNPKPVTPTKRYADSEQPPDTVLVPVATYLFEIEGTHSVPEGGSYSYADRGEHVQRQVSVGPLFVDRTEVTNDQFCEFVVESRYQPDEVAFFLHHWDRGAQAAGEEPWHWSVPHGLGDHPVVYVSLDDSRAYARWAGKRLPTEEEWQFAAQGPELLRWPWGLDYRSDRCNGIDGTLGRNKDIEGADGSTTPVNTFPDGGSPFGVLDMSGNVWEWTESERDTGYFRYAILKGGCYYRAGGSRWFQPGGAQPATRHAKMALLYPGLDRCATVGFRCVSDRYPE